jgi:hypothetical protein
MLERKASITFGGKHKGIVQYSTLNLQSAMILMGLVEMVSIVALIVTHTMYSWMQISPPILPRVDNGELFCGGAKLLIMSPYLLLVRITFVVISPYFLYLLKEVQDSLCIWRELLLYVSISVPLHVSYIISAFAIPSYADIIGIALGVWSYFATVAYPAMVAMSRDFRQRKYKFSHDAFERMLTDPKSYLQFKILLAKQLQVEKAMFFEYFLEVVKLYCRTPSVPIHPEKITEMLEKVKLSEREIEPALILEVSQKVKKIFKVFLSPGAPCGVPLKEETLKMTREKNNKHPTSLLPCWEEIYNDLYNGPYREFASSDQMTLTSDAH